MEKLFSKEDLAKIKHSSFDIQSLSNIGKELTSCSFYTDHTGNILNAYIVKYEVNGSEIEDIFVSFGEKVDGDSIESCVNSARKHLKNKKNIILDLRGVSYGAMDVLANDYLTDEGILYKGIKSETSNQRFPQKIIPVLTNAKIINNAIVELRESITNGRFHVEEDLYNKVIDALSLIEFEIKDDGCPHIHCEKRDYIENIMLIIEANQMLRTEK